MAHQLRSSPGPPPQQPLPPLREDSESESWSIEASHGSSGAREASSASSSTTSLGALIRDVQDSYRGLGPAPESDEDDSTDLEAVRALIRPLNITRRPLLGQTPPDATANQEEIEERRAQIQAPVEPLPMAKKRQSKARHEADKSGNVLKSSPMGISKTAKKKATFDPATLFEENTKLIGVDLQKYFKSSKATETLDEKDRAELRKLLPEDIELNDQSLLTQEFLRYNIDWRNALRYFSLDLQDGRFGEEWLKSAGAAMERRALGHFDEYKQQHFESFWGQKGDAPVKNAPVEFFVGETDKDLEMLVRMEEIVKGDYWYFRQVFGRGRRAVVIEKHCLVVEIKNMTCVLEVPPGRDKWYDYAKAHAQPRRLLHKRNILGDIEAKNEGKAHMRGTANPTMDKKVVSAAVKDTGKDEDTHMIDVNTAASAMEPLTKEEDREGQDLNHAISPAVSKPDQLTHPFYDGLEMRTFGRIGGTTSTVQASTDTRGASLTSSTSIRTPSGHVFRSMTGPHTNENTNPIPPVTSTLGRPSSTSNSPQPTTPDPKTGDVSCFSSTRKTTQAESPGTPEVNSRTGKKTSDITTPSSGKNPTSHVGDETEHAPKSSLHSTPTATNSRSPDYTTPRTRSGKSFFSFQTSPKDHPKNPTNPAKHPHILPARNLDFFVREILQIDGRGEPNPAVNPWTLVHLHRDKKDLGSFEKVADALARRELGV